jgi:uncharacterized protein (TIGR00255 family)
MGAIEERRKDGVEMIRSMTGYGRGVSISGGRNIITEVKSVNNRYRDILVRLPRTLQPLEDDVRSQVASKVRRGRLDVTIQIERKEGQSDLVLDLNLPLARSYYRILTTVSEEFGLQKAIGPLEICQMKDVISYKPEEMDLEGIRNDLKSSLEMALENCDAMRIKEGRALEQELQQRLDRIEVALNEIQARAPLVLEDWSKRVREKLQQLLQGVQVDENRLAQEMVYFADRSDITEEIVRGRSHLAQFRNSMPGDESMGRKLEFLIQELHREVNTISSKASDASISAHAVEIKVELEKMREQVQNVE